MKYFPSWSRRQAQVAISVAIAATVCTVSALGELPYWIRNIEAKSALEAVFFRSMPLPGSAVLFRRPPNETRPALATMIQAKPHQADLYALRAHEDEQQLDFDAAESDWKNYAAASQNSMNAQLALADFYHRRLRPLDEIQALTLITNAPADANDELVPSQQQASWKAFARIFTIIQSHGLSKTVSIEQYRAWVGRYPQEKSLYSKFLQFLVRQKEYGAANELIAAYAKQFPRDPVFPIKARAMVAYREGSVAQSLSVYEHSFHPLWDPDLVGSYFDLLRQTQGLRKFLDQARASLRLNPEDINATARVFYYYQQQGNLAAAQQAIATLRAQKEATHSPWTSEDLFVCARLLEEIHAYPEAARYYFALYNSQGLADAQERALSGLADILLTAPETPIQFGTSDLSIYRDIATLDMGPGYWNCILSLILNTTEPSAKYAEEERRAIPYFHRAQAAKLIGLLDEKFPESALRPALHVKLLEFYVGVSEDDAVIRDGRQFLSDFPQDPHRTIVSLLMAESFARKGDTASEFAIYDDTLKELSSEAMHLPLGASGTSENASAPYLASADATLSEARDDERESNAAVAERESDATLLSSAEPVPPVTGVRSPEYARVLDRYLSRLVALRDIPRALGVLRREIDRNPNDPGIYERLAVFLDQNRLGVEQEQVYKQAIAKFQDRTWYDKLARFYLRTKHDQEFEDLTRRAVASFSGTDLEQYFNDVVSGGSAALYLRLNQYAQARFPHNPVFVRNLLYAYQNPATRDQAAWEALIRQHWFEDITLRNQFFEFLSSTNQLEKELRALEQVAPNESAWKQNLAAADFVANAQLWRSHFEESASALSSLAKEYPADAEVARTASSVFRSLAYFEPQDTALAVEIEDRLSQADPGDTQILARIGDIFADRNRFSEAATYWNRIPSVRPGEPGGYLEAATIYWDYYDFANAVRLLQEGRRHFGDGNLYTYELGAIYENERNYPNAVAEYVKGALSAPGSSAERRLLQLSNRPNLREIVDHATAEIAQPPDPSLPAVRLRLGVLETQGRKSEIDTFLVGVASATSSIELLEDIETIAEQRSLDSVRQHTLERQIAVTEDPVSRLQVRYALIRFYEGRHDFESAQRNIEALYKENPKILGVVRSTVDFYWRTKHYSDAIGVLQQAGRDSHPELSRQFMFEAARKATEAQQYVEAREMLSKLLNQDPQNAEYLAAMADTYGQAGDSRGLKQFYEEKITTFEHAAISGEARKTQIAGFRRGLITALTRLKEYQAAVDQYVELLNTLPEDAGLPAESALYAQRYGRQSQLLDFYGRAVSRSPRDSRWSIVLARIQTALENYPSAIETYGKALAVRPDRADLFTARADLEERLIRMDEAIADYERVYELTYKDPIWMEKVAELCARQGKSRETVAALTAARLTGRPENPTSYADVAQRLEGWGMLTDARDFAERGVNLAGEDLLAEPRYHAVAITFVRIATRLRRQEDAYVILQRSLDTASSPLQALKEQAAKQGIAGISDSNWREDLRQNRIDDARQGMSAALEEMGRAVNTYFTPEERLAFGRFAEAKRTAMTAKDLQTFAIPLAQSAGLADQEARWRFEWLKQRPSKTAYQQPLQEFVRLQRSRTRFAELGTQLEELARSLRIPDRNSFMYPAADAYYSAGDSPNELRVLSLIGAPYLDPARQERLFTLLLKNQPQELIRVAANWKNSASQRAADFLVANGNTALVHQLVAARGTARSPIWTKSYDALVGLYLADPAVAVNDAFLGALGDATVGQRTSNVTDRTEQLAGNAWFYYGSRYGEYLGTTKRGVPKNYLPSDLELSPASASGYRSLAEYYASQGDSKEAITEYEHTLDLAPDRPDVLADLATVYDKRGDRTAALDRWRSAYRALERQVSDNHPPETFWKDFGHICDQLRSRRIFAGLQPEADSVVRAYLRKNGNYRSNAVLEPAYAAINDPTAATAWLLDLSKAANDPAQVLIDVVNAPWIPSPARAPIYERILSSKRAILEKTTGIEREYAQQEFNAWTGKWIQYLVRTQQYQQAAQAIRELPESTRTVQSSAVVPLELIVAARDGGLDFKLAAYQSDPKLAPDAGALREAAKQLASSGDVASSRKIMEFVFRRAIENQELTAPNFLGLAELRLQEGDVAGALTLLRRLTTIVGEPFANLDAAAALLEKTGHSSESIEFLEKLCDANPWQSLYKVRLAKANIAAGYDIGPAQQILRTVASDSKSPYQTRIRAATALSGNRENLGSAGLNLLAGDASHIPVEAADKFYFYDARMAAANATIDPSARFALLSHCVIDFPRREEARIPLFESAIRIKSDEYALGAIRPVLDANGQVGDRSQSAFNEHQPEGDDNGDETLPPLNGTASSGSPVRASLEDSVGELLVRLGQARDAVAHFQTARRLAVSSTERARLRRRIERIQAWLRVQSQNASRQPILHEALEQDRIVRPKLPVGSLSMSPQAKGGANL